MLFCFFRPNPIWPCLLRTTLFAPFFFQDKPVMVEEGLMTLLRKNVVSNARLLKCADGRGLRVRTPPPPPHSDVSRRSCLRQFSPVPSSRVDLAARCS